MCLCTIKRRNYKDIWPPKKKKAQDITMGYGISGKKKNNEELKGNMLQAMKMLGIIRKP